MKKPTVHIRRKNQDDPQDYYVHAYYAGNRKAEKIGSYQAASRRKEQLQRKFDRGDFSFFEMDAPLFGTVFLEELAYKDPDSKSSHEGIKKVQAETIKRTKVIYKNRVEQFIGTMPVDMISKKHITKILKDARKDGVSSTQMTMIKGILRSTLAAAFNDEHVRVNVAREVLDVEKDRGAKAQEKELKGHPMEIEQISAFLKACATHEKPWVKAYYDMFSVLFYCGLRLGECVALTWKDLEENEKGVHLYVNKAFRKKLGKPKTKHGYRRVPVPAELATQLKQRYIASGRPKKAGLIFPNRNGDHDHPNNIRRSFKATLKAADLGHYRIHDTRHSYGANMAKKVPLHVLKVWMGHSDISITSNWYGQPVGSDDFGPVDEFNKEISAGFATFCNSVVQLKKAS